MDSVQWCSMCLSVKYLVFLSITLCVIGENVAAFSQWVKKEETGVFRWHIEEPDGLYFQLVQRNAAQTRAFYLARGFSVIAIDRYAKSCVFHTTLANNSLNRVLEVDLQNWEIESILPTDTGPSFLSLYSTEFWETKWKELNVPSAAIIAFRFSQLPRIQKSGPGSWFQGMISVGLESGAIFNLKIKWLEDGVQREAVLKNVQCISSDRE